MSHDPCSQTVINLEGETNVEINNYNKFGNPLTEIWTKCHGGERTEKLTLFSKLVWL